MQPEDPPPAQSGSYISSVSLPFKRLLSEIIHADGCRHTQRAIRQVRILFSISLFLGDFTLCGSVWGEGIT